MLQYAMKTDVGDRPVNEDSVGCFEHNGNFCFVLCDGLGGHGMGDVASSVVRDDMGELFGVSSENCRGFIKKAFLHAQEKLLSEQEARKAEDKMKTTAVVLAADKKRAYIGHIGDSRLYIFSGGKASFRTHDHSVPQMLVNIGEIKESEIRNHPDRNLVLKVLGVQWDKDKTELEKPVSLKGCDAFLLCSDGFWELIEEDKMSETLKESSSPDEWLEKMTAIVRENGKDRNMDNYSAIAVMNSGK